MAAPVHEIERDELVRIVENAAEGYADSTRAKLLAVAKSTDAVAVGWFHCDGIDCPARQANRGRPVQRFQQKYDYAMAAHFDLDPEDFEPFVVRVKAR